MTYPYFYAELRMQMLGQMLGGIDAAVTAARTSESKHQVGKTAPEVTRHMGIRQFVDAVQERQNLSVLFQKRMTGSSKPVRALYGSYLPGLCVLRQSNT